ncbi:hypothetical protein M3N55_15550 [Roseibaca sp. V10]|uniref:Uncharacterized protein n=1 Tax=Roseinatronobacter domitianus TaxID=2940293 RepID=A0ABT0M753_9RHOB|nr:hypothetical protein [Roseibaca domitiana]MCL1630139.1 hypothetical protein [Roseibaca domitiana]
MPFNSNNTHRTQNDHDWRCSKCFKLLGRRGRAGIHIQFARGHQYILSGTASAVCRSCGTLNET